MKNNFDLKQYLTENKLTRLSEEDLSREMGKELLSLINQQNPNATPKEILDTKKRNIGYVESDQFIRDKFIPFIGKFYKDFINDENFKRYIKNKGLKIKDIDISFENIKKVMNNSEDYSNIFKDWDSFIYDDDIGVMNDSNRKYWEDAIINNMSPFFLEFITIIDENGDEVKLSKYDIDSEELWTEPQDFAYQIIKELLKGIIPFEEWENLIGY